jgi:hypothetical protein
MCLFAHRVQLLSSEYFFEFDVLWATWHWDLEPGGELAFNGHVSSIILMVETYYQMLMAGHQFMAGCYAIVEPRYLLANAAVVSRFKVTRQADFLPIKLSEQASD